MMTSKQESKSTRPLHNEYPLIHSRNSKSCLKNDDISQNRSSSTAVLDSINQFYTYLGSTRENLQPDPGMNGCFAVRLALFLIETISHKKFTLSAGGCFSRGFYRHCLESAARTDLADEINDPELMVIYIKQCLRLLESTGILKRGGRQALINTDEASTATIFHKLFNAFWNTTPWEDLFPSDTESARELKATRGILKDLLLRRNGAVSIGAIANEFFEMTGFSNRNNLFMISFLDFYFFTWLNHFGLVRYSNESDLSPVRLTVTDRGRKSLNSF
jgi:hypothetical protein